MVAKNTRPIIGGACDKQGSLLFVKTERMVRPMKEKKKNIFTRIKDKWNELDEDTKDWTKITAIWTFDGLLWGSIITAIRKEKKMVRVAKNCAAAGYIQGQMDAYKEMAQNPYRTVNRMIDAGEKNGTMKRINF